MDLPPDVRQALLNLLIAAINDLIQLIKHVVEGIINPQPTPAPLPPPDAVG